MKERWMKVQHDVQFVIFVGKNPNSLGGPQLRGDQPLTKKKKNQKINCGVMVFCLIFFYFCHNQRRPRVVTKKKHKDCHDDSCH